MDKHELRWKQMWEEAVIREFTSGHGERTLVEGRVTPQDTRKHYS